MFPYHFEIPTQYLLLVYYEYLFSITLFHFRNLRLNKIPLTKLTDPKFFKKTWNRIGYIIFTLMPYYHDILRGYLICLKKLRNIEKMVIYYR